MAPNRMLLAVLIAAVAVGAAWLVLQGDAPATPTTAAAAPDRTDDPSPPDPLSAERARLREAPAKPASGTVDRPAADAGAPPPAPDSGTMHVRVLDRVGGQPVEAFRFVLRCPDQPRLDRAVRGAEADLQMPLDRDVRLRVEAEGFEPQDFTLRLTAAEPERRVRFELERTVQAAGIELRVQTPLLAPVTHLQVRAVRIDPARPSDGVELWHRRDAEVDGVYRLPEMSAGTYRFELQAVTETGSPLPLLPHVETVRFGGAESISRMVQLRDGALIELEVHDAAGALLGTDVLVRVVHPAVTDPELRWQATIDGETVVGVGGLPGAAAAVTAEALPPGACTLQLRRGNGPVVERALVLHAGTTEKVAITLPD